MSDSGDLCFPVVCRPTSIFSFTNVKTSLLGSVNRNISTSTKMLIQSDAYSCMFQSLHWQPHNSRGSGTCSWSCPQPGRAGQLPQLQAAPQVPIRSLGFGPLDSPLPHPSISILGRERSSCTQPTQVKSARWGSRGKPAAGQPGGTHPGPARRCQEGLL